MGVHGCVCGWVVGVRAGGCDGASRHAARDERRLAGAGCRAPLAPTHRPPAPPTPLWQLELKFRTDTPKRDICAMVLNEESAEEFTDAVK